MIWTYLVLFLVEAFTRLLTTLNLQPVITLPQVLGIDVDSLLLQGVGMSKEFFFTFWAIGDMFVAALVILSYLVLKNIALRTFLGHRTPGTH